MATGPHVSLAAETLFTVNGFPVTNSIFTSLLVSAFLILFALGVRTQLKQTDKPTGLQNLVEWIMESLFEMINSVTQNKKKATEFFPYIATFFLFILLNNWLGLLPGVGTIGVVHETTGEAHASAPAYSIPAKIKAATEENIHNEATPETHEEPMVKDHAEESTHEEATHATFIPLFRPGTADLNTTLALAIFSVLITQVIGFRHLQFGYFSKFINFSNPIMFFVGILETVSEFAKIISFAFRLFGNIFAGEVLLVVISFLVPVIVPMPFYGLEIFVGFIQALVFAMLSLVFFNMATISHDDH